jgi:hypothetical protein
LRITLQISPKTPSFGFVEWMCGVALEKPPEMFCST